MSRKRICYGVRWFEAGEVTTDQRWSLGLSALIRAAIVRISSILGCALLESTLKQEL